MFKCLINKVIFILKMFLKKLLTSVGGFAIICLASSDDDAVCGSVGTGRRARLRILWQQCRVGSSPIFRIVKKKDSNEKSFGSFLFQKRERPLNPGFKVSSPQSGFIGRFGGKKVH